MSTGKFLNKGFSMAVAKSFPQKLSCFLGVLSLKRHRQIQLGKGCCISPEAWVHPRESTIRIGDRSSVGPGVMLQGNITIGEDCSVQVYSVLTGYPKGEIRIGNGVRIASHTVFVGANHRYEDPAVPIRLQGLREAPIVVEDDVWIGSHVCVLAGVTIGRGSVIGAGSVVTKSIPPNSIAVGVPAKVIRKR